MDNQSDERPLFNQGNFIVQYRVFSIYYVLSTDKIYSKLWDNESLYWPFTSFDGLHAMIDRSRVDQHQNWQSSEKSLHSKENAQELMNTL